MNLKVVLPSHRRVRDFPKEFTTALMLQATTTYSCVTNHRIVKDETRRLGEPSGLPAHCWPGGEAVVTDGTAPRPDAARRNEITIAIPTAASRRRPKATQQGSRRDAATSSVDCTNRREVRPESGAGSAATAGWRSRAVASAGGNLVPSGGASVGRPSVRGRDGADAALLGVGRSLAGDVPR